MLAKNVRIMLALLLVGFCYTFVCGNNDCDDSITVSTEGDVEDWFVTGLDSAIENAATPVLDFGDAMVDTTRDTLEGAVEWGFDSTMGGQ